jgi:hypothetical protein
MLEFPDTLPLGIEWPDINPIRIVLLLAEIACVIFGLHLAYKFFKNYRTLHDTVHGSRMHAAWGWLFFGYAITQIIYIIADFYAMDQPTRDIYIILGYLSVSTGALFYIFNIEGVGVIKSRHAFTIIFGALYVTLIVMVVLYFSAVMVSFTLIQVFSTSFWVPMLLLFLIYTGKINKLVRGKMHVYSTMMVIGILTFSLGFIGATDAAIRNLGGLAIRLLADILTIAGIGMLGLFFSMLPSWREIEWRAALKTLFVVYKGGIVIYQHDFEKQSDDMNSSTMMMVGGALEMVKSLLQQVTSGQLKVLDFQDKKMLLEQGETAMVVMIADTESESLSFLLHEYLIRFERFFQPILVDWPGDIADFTPAKALLHQVFG